MSVVKFCGSGMYSVRGGVVATHRGVRVRAERAAAHHALVVHHVGVLRRRHAAAATNHTAVLSCYTNLVLSC